MGTVFVIIIAVLVIGGVATAVVWVHRLAARNSRRIGAPDARPTATFLGSMWWPGKINTGVGTVRLEFFDWGIRLRGSFVVGRLFVPVWEARYAELTEARRVTAPTHQGVRLRADGGDPVFFWTRRDSAVLDRLEEHTVPVDRAADQAPEPPPISSGPANTGT